MIFFLDVVRQAVGYNFDPFLSREKHNCRLQRRCLNTVLAPEYHLSLHFFSWFTRTSYVNRITLILYILCFLDLLVKPR